MKRTRGFQLAALVDASAEVRKWAAAELGVPVFSRLDEALEREPAEAVLLVSPPETHRPLGELAIAHGLHVLTEKPLTLTLDDARALVKLSERTGLHVMVTQNYRFRRQSRALEALVSSGALGRLLGIRVVCRRDLRNSWIIPRHWRSEMAHPYLLDMAIHHVDLLRMITGREIRGVDALAWRVPDSPFRMEPNVQALFVLDDGTPVAYEGDFAAAISQTSWNGDWEIVGDRARALWIGGTEAPLRGRVVIERYAAPAETVVLPRLAVLDRVAVLHEFRRSIAEGTSPECSAADNIESLAATLRIARSAEARRPVRR